MLIKSAAAARRRSRTDRGVLGVWHRLQYFNKDYEGALATQRAGRQSVPWTAASPRIPSTSITSLSNEAVILATHEAIRRSRTGAPESGRVAGAQRRRRQRGDQQGTCLPGHLAQPGRTQAGSAGGVRPRASPRWSASWASTTRTCSSSGSPARRSCSRWDVRPKPCPRWKRACLRPHPRQRQSPGRGRPLAHPGYALLGRCKEAQAILAELQRRKIAFPADRDPPLKGTRCSG